jgi:hypothetical protein
MSASSFRSGGRNFSAMKFVMALRGRGALISPQGEIPVRYGIDVFEERGRRTAGGWVTGVGAFKGIKTAALRLSDGVQLEVAVEDGDLEGASVEVINASEPALVAATSSPLAVRALMSGHG